MESAPPYSVTLETVAGGCVVYTIENGRETTRRFFAEKEEADKYLQGEKRRLGLGW